MRKRSALFIFICGLVHGAVPADEVKKFPGFDGVMPSKVYSGYLKAEALSASGKMQVHCLSTAFAWKSASLAHTLSCVPISSFSVFSTPGI